MNDPSFIPLFSGALVFLAAAGFTIMNAGLCRAHASASICLMSLGGCAMGALAYYFLGDNLMYRGVGSYGVMGSFSLFFSPEKSGGTAAWFYHMALAAAASSIILGALGERIKIWAFILFAGFFCAVIYPVAGAWTWGGGILKTIGFHDFGGSAVIHVTAGCAALTGVRFLGPRSGRYAPDGRPIPFPGSNIPMAALGAFLIIIGWMGVIGGHAADAASAGAAYMNAALACASACTASLIYVSWRYNKPDITIVLNGTLAGLAAISAGADGFSPFFSCFVGAVGGILCVNAVPLLDRYKIDDPVGVVPAHLIGGAWGILAASFLGNPLSHIAGLAAIGAFTVFSSSIAWKFAARLMGLRCPDKSLRHGVDVAEMGLEAYPDFPVRTAGRPDITQIDKY